MRKYVAALTTGLYIDIAEQKEDDKPFDQKMQCIAAQLTRHQAKAHHPDEIIWENFKPLEYGY